jgi:hypothetical protein
MDAPFFDIEIQYIGTIMGLKIFKVLYNRPKIKGNFKAIKFGANFALVLWKRITIIRSGITWELN